MPDMPANQQSSSSSSLAGGAGLRELIAKWREPLGKPWDARYNVVWQQAERATLNSCANELEAVLSALPDVGEHLRAVEQEREKLRERVAHLEGKLEFNERGYQLVQAQKEDSDLRAEQAEAERDAALRYKTAYDEINRVWDEADALLKASPRSYLGWNWVHALVDALKQARKEQR